MLWNSKENEIGTAEINWIFYDVLNLPILFLDFMRVDVVTNYDFKRNSMKILRSFQICWLESNFVRELEKPKLFYNLLSVNFRDRRRTYCCTFS